MNPAQVSAARSPALQLMPLAMISGVVLLAGYFIAPAQALDSLLVGAYALLTVSLGGLVFMALEAVTGAQWSRALRPLYAALAGNLWMAGLAMLMVVAWRRDSYTWSPADSGDPGTMWFKALWLDPTWLVARAAGYVSMWTLLAFAMVRSSRPPRGWTADYESRWRKPIAAIALLVFAPTISLASYDWFMSLDPLWFSTMWGVYHFAGLATSTLAVVALWAIHAQRHGPGREPITNNHLHDLGKLLLGFCCFWMYIWYCQYMLIWYSNIPEETEYFVVRSHGAWQPLQVANVALNGVIPFLALLPQPSKRSPTIISRVATIVLLGRWLDLYLMVYPATMVTMPGWGIYEVATIVFACSAGAWWLLKTPPLADDAIAY